MIFTTCISRKTSFIKNILITVSIEMIQAEPKFNNLGNKHNRYFTKHLQLFTGNFDLEIFLSQNMCVHYNHVFILRMSVG